MYIKRQELMSDVYNRVYFTGEPGIYSAVCWLKINNDGLVPFFPLFFSFPLLVNVFNNTVITAPINSICSIQNISYCCTKNSTF